MRSEHHQCYHHLLGAFASTVAACKSSRRYIFSHICAQLLISAYGVSFVHLVMKHPHFFSTPSASELGAFSINQNLLTSLLNTSALPYCSSGTISGSLLARFKMTYVHNFHLHSYQYPQFLPFTSESRSTNPLLSFLFNETPKY